MLFFQKIKTFLLVAITMIGFGSFTAVYASDNPFTEFFSREGYDSCANIDDNQNNDCGADDFEAVRGALVSSGLCPTDQDCTQGQYSLFQVEFSNSRAGTEEAPSPGPDPSPSGGDVPTFRSPTEFGYQSPVGNDTTINSFISRIIKFALGIVGAVFLAMLIYSGILWMTAGSQFSGSGDKPGSSTSQIAKAKASIKNAVIGMAIVALSYAIVTTVFNVGNSVLRSPPAAVSSGSVTP